MLLKMIPNLENKLTYKWIYDVLKLNILEFILAPGQKLSEVKLAKQFAVSRTLIRESLVLLEAEGLILVFPKSGTFVSKISLKVVYDDLFFRQTLEEKILLESFQNQQNFDLTKLKNILKDQIECAKAVKPDTILFHQLDNQFHRSIFELVGKATIWDRLQFNISTHERIRCIELVDKSKMSLIINQHQEEIKMIKKKKKTNITQFIETHTENFKTSLELFFHDFPDFFID